MPLHFEVPSNNGKLNLYIPSIYEQTGWSRSNPLHLLTDYDLLLKVICFNYDLLNRDFVDYAKSRGCMNGAGSPSPIDPDYNATPLDLSYEVPEELKHDPYTIRRFVRCHWLRKDDFMTSKEKIYTIAVNGKKPKAITGKDKETLWSCIPPTRATLQDCWEVYLINICNAVVSI